MPPTQAPAAPCLHTRTAHICTRTHVCTQYALTRVCVRCARLRIYTRTRLCAHTLTHTYAGTHAHACTPAHGHMHTHTYTRSRTHTARLEEEPHTSSGRQRSTVNTYNNADKTVYRRGPSASGSWGGATPGASASAQKEALWSEGGLCRGLCLLPTFPVSVILFFSETI